MLYPFSTSTKLDFNLPDKGMADISIYNIKGQKVKTLLHETVSKGKHDIVWNGRDETGRQVGSGMYLVKLKAGSREVVKKVMMVR